MKTHFKFGIPIALGFAFFITACNGLDNGSKSSNSTALNEAAGTGIAASKIYVENATAQEISEFVTACSAEEKTGKSSKYICVQICHVPPGNSAAQHTKVLHLPATLAHLGHGDYLGACVTDETDNGTVDPGDSTGEEVTLPDNFDELPLWCQQNYAVDSDCDGWEDATGQPLY